MALPLREATVAEAKTDWEPSVASRLAFLEREIARRGVDRARIDLPASDGVTLGLDVDGTITVGIPCDPDDVDPDDRSAAVQVRAVPTGCRIVIHATANRRTAASFVEAVFGRLSDGAAPGGVGRSVLVEWRDLLARSPGSPLSDDALVGLFGELEVLERIVARGGSLSHWTGWQRDHNDFRLPELAIEVKSTTSADFRRVEIHGLGQLADPQDGSDLVLVLRRLESSPAGRSVPDLVDVLVRLGISRSELLQCLSNVGYSEEHRPFYDGRRFVSEETVVRRVDADHPRLTPDRLRQIDLTAIGRVDYTLDLNSHHESDLEQSLDELIAAALEAT